VLVTQAQSDHLLLDVVAVAPTAQGGGHGRAMLARADQDAREQGLSEIRLCTNEAMTENLEFYPRRGFRETSRAVQDGFHRVFFAKAVTAGEPPPAVQWATESID
jgi:N-acetylglutamate synthase-like GNAT family acetyltransferase